MSICNDTVEARNQAALLGDDSFISSPTIQLYQLNAIQLEFEQNIVAPIETNRYVNLYGQEAFNTGLISFNNFLLSAKTNVNLNLAEAYPSVKDRIDRGVAITPIEYTVFMDSISSNPITLPSIQVTRPKDVLRLYDTSLRDTFTKSTMGTFCELAPSIFGAIGGFFDQIQSFANKITDIINKIQNLSLAALLDSLKKKIIAVVENAIERVKKIIENLSFDNLISSVNQFFHSKILAKFQNLKENAMKFFEEFNVDNFKKKIEGLISYAANIFKDPKIEEIQFLIYRFCTFITGVENIINSIKRPIDQYTERYISATERLKSNTKVNTGIATGAGANRNTDEDIRAAIARGVDSERLRGNQPKPTIDEYKDLPQWNNGRGDSRITFSGNWTRPPGPGCSGGLGIDGWNMPNDNHMINIDAKVYLMRLQKAFSARTDINQLIVKSAYRSPRYNQCLRDRGIAAARNSKHMEGHAFDIGWAGFPRHSDVFIELARSFGFKGIGSYPPNAGRQGFIHIDRGPERSWRG